MLWPPRDLKQNKTKNKKKQKTKKSMPKKTKERKNKKSKKEKRTSILKMTYFPFQKEGSQSVHSETSP